ncbi:acyl-CoA synthetase FdrA [Amycolatopsis jejuensis]|uniref:acyl-CoA synthetase FdrA n=1 Tax=Amycolatopsis jejuensis TaxID=330084 RepID=UPI00052449E6|nr:acyl-CoA synthetase FdrA [Amycolatopsis jejuensis]
MTARNIVFPNSYFDSVVLMRTAATLGARPGVRAASLLMATEPNRQVLADAGLLAAEAGAAGPNDLIVAVDCDDDLVDSVLAAAGELLEDRPAVVPGDLPAPRTLAAVADTADLAVISTPGRYAAAEALKALRLGLHVFLFSDNVDVRDEVRLKRYAHERGLLVMGPDCGTAILNGVPLAFANVVRPGRIGLVSASGTGLQQVSTLLDAWGAGVSQVLGVGGRDLSADVGGLSTLDALDALAADPGTDVIVLISKPPAPSVADLVLRRASGLGKPVVATFLGGAASVAGVTVVSTLDEAAGAALRLALGVTPPAALRRDVVRPANRRLLRALFAGGTFACEARAILGPVLGEVASAVERYLPGTPPVLPDSHLILDLGDDAFTVGRPHPMIDPTSRLDFLRAAAADPETAVVLLDVVLGHGAGPDPAGALAPAIAAMTPQVVAFVVGTAGDPQGLAEQQRKLTDAGAMVARSSTEAAQLAGEHLTEAAMGAAS